MRGIFVDRWWIVFATVCGLIVGSGAINVFAFGVFLRISPCIAANPAGPR
jgi:hypothetical protein